LTREINQHFKKTSSPAAASFKEKDDSLRALLDGVAYNWH